MLAIINTKEGQPLTIGSRDIADLVGSRHDKVKQSIERLAEKGIIDLPPSGEYLDTLGRRAHEYRIGERDSYVIVAQLSPAFCARLVDRWRELEAQAHTHRVPQTLAEALRLAADLADTVEQQSQLLAAQAPAVEFIGRYVDAHGLYSLREAAKVLGVKERQFIDYLITNRIIFRQSDGKTLLPYADMLGKAFFEVKTGEKYGHTYKQAHVTAAGMAWLGKKINLIGLPQ